MYGVQLPKNVWHTIESLEPDTCAFEVKEGPFVSHEDGGILERKDRLARGVMLRIGFVACCMKLRIFNRRQSI